MLSLLDKNTLAIDGSGLKLATCLRRYQIAYNDGRIPTGGRSALLAGSALHAALRIKYETDAYQQVKEATRKAAHATIQKEFAKGTPDPEDWRTPQRIQETFDLYCKHYGRRVGNLIAIEMPFCHPLGSILVDGTKYHILWQGRIDRVHQQGSQIWICDWKTTTRFDYAWQSDWELDVGQLGYCWYWQQHSGQKPVGSMITPIIWRPPTASGKSKFPRTEFPNECPYLYTQERIDEWRQNVLGLCAIILQCHQSGHWPALSSCIGRYGRCAYLDVCTLPQAERQKLLATNQFQKNDWTPLQ